MMERPIVVLTKKTGDIYVSKPDGEPVVEPKKVSELEHFMRVALCGSLGQKLDPENINIVHRLKGEPGPIIYEEPVREESSLIKAAQAYFEIAPA